ncbi:MAG: radical SAM protein, partial [Negativicutes bacterium]|nr:radical SAM protein [Negativicutes bacterium]
MKRLQVMVTQRCNSSCSYCMVARAGKDLEEGVLDRLPDILAEGDFDVVMLFGGEPLLREDLCYAIKEKSGGRKIMLPTNGKLLTDRHIADFGHVLISANGTAESCRLTGQSSVPAILRLAAKDRCTIGMRIIPETAARMKEDFDYFHAAGFSKYNIVPIIELDWDEAAYQHYRQGVEYILAKIPREQIWTWKQGGICVPYHGTTCLDQTGQLWGCA